MPRKLSGGCACGAIRYACDADPVIMTTTGLINVDKDTRDYQEIASILALLDKLCED